MADYWRVQQGEREVRRERVARMYDLGMSIKDMTYIEGLKSTRQILEDLRALGVKEPYGRARDDVIRERRRRVEVLWNEGYSTKRIASKLGMKPARVRFDLRALEADHRVFYGVRRYPRGLSHPDICRINAHRLGGLTAWGISKRLGIRHDKVLAVLSIIEKTFPLDD